VCGRAASGGTTPRVLARAALVAVVCISPVRVAKAGTLPPNVVNGVTWLKQQIQSDGSLAGESASIATPVQAREEVAQTLAELDTVPTAVVAAAQGDPDLNAEYASRRIIALQLAGEDASSLVTTLLTYQNPDGGFGTYAGYSSSPLETAWALLALKAAGASGSVLGHALQYLIGAANSDGGFDAFHTTSDVYTTSVVTLALQAYAQAYSLSATIGAADAWLRNAQSGGGYDDTLSDAVATLALASTTTDSSAYSASVQALEASQLTDGSWNDDPYLTAIALRALVAAGSVPAAPTTGQVSGQVVDASTLAPLSGVTIQLAQQSGTQVTNSSGQYSLSSLAPGSYTLTASLAGYTSQQLTVSVTAGATTDAPLIKLGAIPPTVGVLQGTVTDGATGQPLGGVLITVSDGGNSASATTASNGTYVISGLQPGSITVTATLSGYQTVSGSGQIVAGGTLLFSPTDYPDATTPPTTATLTGTVVDAGTGQPISGATVSTGGQTATTDSQGQFSIAGLAVGAFSAQISANGYDGASLSGSLTAGNNEAGVVRLSAPVEPPTLTSSTVSGTITAGQPAAAVAGATVSIKGTALVATTDGNGRYTISGIATQSFEVDVSAPGYIGQSALMPGPGFGNYTASFTLNPAASSGFDFTNVATSSSSYDPYGTVEIGATVENKTSAATPLAFTATIYDSNHNVVASVAAGGAALGQGQPNALETVGADSALPISLTWDNLATPAGQYSAVIDATTADGSIVAEGVTAFSIKSEAQVTGGITLNPPVATAGVDQSVNMTARVINDGNLPVPAGLAEFQVVLTTPDPSAATQSPASVIPWYSGSLLSNPTGAVFDAQGNFYTLSGESILKVTPAGVASTYLQLPCCAADLAIDSAGDLFAAMSSTVLKISPTLQTTSIPTGLLYSDALDVDAAGNLYVLGAKDGGDEDVLESISTTGQTTTLVGDGLSYPVGAVADASGNLFVTNSGDGTISEISPSGQITPYASGLNSPQGITEDAQGNLYVANSGAGSIVKVAPGGAISTYATGLKYPYDLRFNSSGELLVTDPSTSTVHEVAHNGAVTTFAESIASYPEGLAYDASGDLYIANSSSSNTLTKLASDGTASVVSTSLSSPRGVAVDSSGNVFVANWANGTISEISGTTTTAFASGLSTPYGLTFGNAGTLYVAESGANRISEVNGSGQVSTVAVSLINNPQAILTDSQGVTYVLNSSFIASIPSFDTAGSVLFKGFGSATKFAFVPGGGFYVLDGSTIKEVSSTGAITTVTTVPYSISGLAVDAAGNIYFTDYFNRTLDKLDSAGNKTVIATLPGQPLDAVLDGSGGLYVLAGGQVLDVSGAGAVTTIASGINNGESLTLAPNGTLYVGAYYAVYAISPTHQVTTFASGWSGPVAVGMTATGDVLIAQPYTNRLDEYDPQGTVLNYLDGFSQPTSLVWDGSRLLFADSSGAVFALVPGQNPQMLLSSGAQGYLAYANGVLYATTRGGTVNESVNGGAFQPFFTGADINSTTGIAVRGDGAVTVANQFDSRVLTVNSAGQVVASYAGIESPYAIAVDSADNVYVSSSSQNEILKITPDGKQASVFATSVTATSMTFGPDGNLLVNTGTGFGIRSYDLKTGAQSQLVGNTPGGGLAQSGNTTYVVNREGATVDEIVGGQLQTFAAGIMFPRGVRVGPDGSVYVANNANGTIVRYSGGKLSDFATNIPGPYSLALAPGGGLYVGTTGGDIVGIGSNGQQMDFGVSTLDMGKISGVAAGASGELTVVGQSPYPGKLFRVKPPQSIAAPAPGTVVFTGSVAVPAMAVGDPAPASLDLGSWVPEFAGDYTVTLTPAGGIGGSLTNTLHVGPHANGQIVATPGVMPPGDQPVSITAQVQGADFESFSSVDASALQPLMAAGTYPLAMGADTAGNIYFVPGNQFYGVHTSQTIERIGSGGSTTTFATLPGTATAVSLGSLPVDPQNNLYVGASDNNVYKIAPDGTPSVFASLPKGIVSIALSSTNDLIVLLSDGSVDRVSSNANGQSISTIGTVPGGAPHELTLDGRDDIYVQTGGATVGDAGALYQMQPDGSVVALATGSNWEGEGSNIAGDCGNNLYLTPWGWPAANIPGPSEENILAEIIGSTGHVGQVFQFPSNIFDIDFVGYDRYGERLLFWADWQREIYSVPLTCGAIGAQLHVVLPSGQSASGFNIAPTATLAQSDGSTDYEWDLKSVTALGQNVTFNTTLNGLTLGESAPVARKAYLEFTNSFSNQPLTLDLAVPQVQVQSNLTLSVSTNQASYPANAPVAISSLITSTGPPDLSGSVSVVIQDSSGATVANLGSTAFGPVTAGAQTTLVSNWNTGTVLAGQYQVYAQMYDSAGDLIGKAQAPITVGASGPGGNGSGGSAQVVTLRTTTDRQMYNTSDQVTINDLVQNVSANQPVSNASLTVQVTSPTGQVVGSQTVALGELVPGGSSEPLIAIPFSNVAQGTYQVTATVLDGSGSVLASATASYQVVENPALTLKGNVSAQSASLYVGQSQVCTDVVTNDGTLAVSGLAVQQALVRLDQSATISTSAQSLDLAPGASQQFLQGFSTAALTPGDYGCVLQAEVGGAWQTLGYAAFKVTQPPIKINAQLALGSKGRVLALLDDTPMPPCGPIRDLELWAAFHTRLPDDAQVEVELLDANGKRVDSETVTPASFRGDVHRSPAGPAALLIEGISSDVITVDVRGEPELAPGYQVKVTATAASLPAMTLETGVMGSACGWPTKEGAHFGDFASSRVSLPFGAAPPAPGEQEPSPDQRRTFLEALLRQEGWSYTVVTDEESFEQDVLSGDYDEYALFAERLKLEDQMQKVVREAVNRGEGLLDADEHDEDEEAGLADALGIQFAGRQSDATSVQFLGTGLPEAGTMALSFPRDALRARVDGAHVAALFPGLGSDRGWGDMADANGQRAGWRGWGWGGFHGGGDGILDAAVTTNDFGQGQSVYAGYDLLAEATQAGAASLEASALADSLTHIMPSLSSLHAGEVIPLHLSLQNQGIATSGQAVMTLPAGVTVVDPGAGTVSSGALTWPFTLAVGQTADLYAWVQLPDASGQTAFDALIQTSDNGTFTDYGHATFTASTSAYATIADALSLAGASREFRESQFWLQTAQRWLGRNEPRRALASLLAATDELQEKQPPQSSQAADAAQAAQLRLDIDQAIWTLSRQVASGDGLH
jgi:sugar lactone lactonase YvrE